MPLRCRASLSAALLLVVVTGSAAGQVLPIPQGPDRDLDLQLFTAEGLRDYTAMLNDWTRALRRGDARAAARFYTDDATIRLVDGTELVGRMAIDNHLAENVVAGSELDMGVNDFAVGGSLGYAMGRYVLRPDASHPAATSSGTYVAVVRRAGRTWRIRALVFTRDPAPAGAAQRSRGLDPLQRTDGA